MEKRSLETLLEYNKALLYRCNSPAKKKHEIFSYLENRISKIDSEIKAEERERDHFINSLSDSRVKKLAELHLVQGLTLEECAEEMHYSTFHIMRLWKPIKDICKKWL